MNIRSRLSLSLPLLLVLAACSNSEAPAPVAPTGAPTTQEAAPEAAPAAGAADAAPATGAATSETAPAATEASAPAPAPAAPTGPAPVAGVDYIEIAGGQPFQATAGKIEVAEVFGYTCGHCAQFEPAFKAWKARQPADVQVTLVPAAFGGYWLPYARAFFTAEALGVQEQTHDAVFAAIHLQRTLPVGNNVGAAEIAPFYAGYGVDEKKFTDTFNSFGVDAKLNRARQFAVKTRIEGTPSLVVAGKYTIAVDQQGFDKMLRTADWLVAQERAGAR